MIDKVETFTALEDFSFGVSTSVYHSCSVMLYGEMYLFGGDDSFSNQYSRVGECGLSSTNPLPFYFNYGTCTEFYQPLSDTHGAFLCFTSATTKNACWSFDSGYFMLEASTKFDHYESTLATYNDGPFAIGGDNGLKVEHFSMSPPLRWATVDPIPVSSNQLRWFSTVTHEKVVYVFGGYEGDYQYVGDTYSYNGQWSKGANLLRPRAGHRSVIFDDAILHIGGYNKEDEFDM